MGSKQHLPYARWTTADLKLILREHDAGITSKQIWAAHFPDRALSSVEKHLTRLQKERGVVRRNRTPA